MFKVSDNFWGVYRKSIYKTLTERLSKLYHIYYNLFKGSAYDLLFHEHSEARKSHQSVLC